MLKLHAPLHNYESKLCQRERVIGQAAFLFQIYSELGKKWQIYDILGKKGKQICGDIGGDVHSDENRHVLLFH